jgi:hypothetical protein
MRRLQGHGAWPMPRASVEAGGGRAFGVPQPPTARTTAGIECILFPIADFMRIDGSRPRQLLSPVRGKVNTVRHATGARSLCPSPVEGEGILWSPPHTSGAEHYWEGYRWG